MRVLGIDNISGFKKVILFSCMAILLLCGNLMAEDKKMVAILTGVKNKVEVKRSNTIEWIKLKVRDYLYEGDFIRSGKKSQADISFISGVSISVKENTEMEIKLTGIEDKGRDTKIELFRGKIFNRVRKLSSLHIQTPQAVASVRGTGFGVEVSDFTHIYVLAGIVDVWNDHGKVELNEGMETTVESGKPPEQPTQMSEDDRQDKKDESIEEKSLKLSIQGELVVGKPIKMKLSVIDNNGNIAEDFDGKIRIESSKSMQYTRSIVSFTGTSQVAWEDLPVSIKSAQGESVFYLKSENQGSRIISCMADNVLPVAVELDFSMPAEKELIIDVDDNGIPRKMKILFKRQN